jgi:PAS domain S-box-containing protein
MPPFVPASLYSTIVDHVHIGIFVVDRHDRVVLWNRFMVSHTGLPAEQVVGHDLFQCFPDLPRQWLKDKLEQAASLGGPLTVHWRERPCLFRFAIPQQRPGDPDHMRQDCRFIPIGSGGRVDAICVCITDVTEVSRYQGLLEQTNVELTRDLELTAAVQALVLPKTRGVSLPHLSLSSYFRPSTQCGGDWWWHERRADDSVLIFVGDVSGHGPHAAMVTMAVASTFQTINELDTAVDVLRVLAAMDRCLRRLGDYQMTMLAAEVGPGGARWWSAAAPPVFVMRADGQMDTVRTGGSMIGGERLEVESGHERLGTGDRFMLFTDGAYEFSWKKGQFGLKRLQRLFGETRAMGLDDATEHISGSIALAGPHEDDITLVVGDLA